MFPSLEDLRTAMTPLGGSELLGLKTLPTLVQRLVTSEFSKMLIEYSFKGSKPVRDTRTWR